MKMSMGLWCLLFVACGREVAAIDLEAARRPPTREPAYLGQPQYALLVFGRDARTAVWIVRDGKFLYIDRNGDGDLTAPEERVVSSFSSTTSAGEDVQGFDAGDIVDGHLVHRKLRIDTVGLARFRGRWAREFVASHPGVCGYSLSIESEFEIGPLGKTRRVMQWVQNADPGGVLQFAASPDRAPILNFGGELQLQHYFSCAVFENRLVRGRESDFILTLATPGSGPGSTVLTGFTGLMPAGAVPVLDCEFETVEGEKPMRAQFRLPERCCGMQLYGKVNVPQAASGTVVNCRVFMTGWDVGRIAPSTFQVQLEDVQPVPERPVSPGMIRTLTHAIPSATLCSLSFTPDGSILMAGGVPDGIIELWNVADGKSLRRIETGQRSRSPRPFVIPSHDGQTIYSWNTQWTPSTDSLSTNVKSSLTRWNAKTGGLVCTHSPPPGHGIFSFDRSPADDVLFLVEQKENGCAAELCDLSGRTSNSLATDRVCLGAFARHGRLLATIETGDTRYAKLLRLVDVPGGKPVLTIPLNAPYIAPLQLLFGPEDRSVVLISLRYGSFPDFAAGIVTAAAWDVTSGKPIWHNEFPPEADLEAYFAPACPTGRVVDIVTVARDGSGDAEVALIDPITGQRSAGAKFPRETTFIDRVYSPDGQRMALATQLRPLATHRLGPDELPQAEVHIMQTSTGRVVRTLVLPRGELASLAFSPDGRWLATGSTGAAHLWDVSEE